MRQNLKAYKQVNLHSSLLESNPHQVILMMFDGAFGGLNIGHESHIAGALLGVVMAIAWPINKSLLQAVSAPASDDELNSK